MLSGGERSLTAMAFLFAIFTARPSPFYLMDEVEPALDDVNLHRFLRLTEGFARESQVLIVTHQKRTMEIAGMMYGISLNKDGTTKVVAQTPGAARHRSRATPGSRANSLGGVRGRARGRAGSRAGPLACGPWPSISSCSASWRWSASWRSSCCAAGAPRRCTISRPRRRTRPDPATFGPPSPTIPPSRNTLPLTTRPAHRAGRSARRAWAPRSRRSSSGARANRPGRTSKTS